MKITERFKLSSSLPANDIYVNCICFPKYNSEKVIVVFEDRNSKRHQRLDLRKDEALNLANDLLKYAEML